MTTSAERVTGMRTCVGCRERGHRSDLVRLVVDRTATTLVVVVDPRAVLPGRGVWLHPRPGCLDRAVTRRAIGRGLRLAQPADTAAVSGWFDQHLPTSSSIIDQESGFSADGHPMSALR